MSKLNNEKPGIEGLGIRLNKYSTLKDFIKPNLALMKKNLYLGENNYVQIKTPLIVILINFKKVSDNLTSLHIAFGKSLSEAGNMIELYNPHDGATVFRDNEVESQYTKSQKKYQKMVQEYIGFYDNWYVRLLPLGYIDEDRFNNHRKSLTGLNDYQKEIIEKFKYNSFRDEIIALYDLYNQTMESCLVFFEDYHNIPELEIFSAHFQDSVKKSDYQYRQVIIDFFKACESPLSIKHNKIVR